MASLGQRLDGLGPSVVTGPEAAARLGIEDHAAYPWRGYLLDSSRTFWPVDAIIDLLGLLRLARSGQRLPEGHRDLECAPAHGL